MKRRPVFKKFLNDQGCFKVFLACWGVLSLNLSMKSLRKMSGREYRIKTIRGEIYRGNSSCNFKWHMNNVVKWAFSLRLKQTKLWPRIAHRYRWKRGWSWPCFDTTLLLYYLNQVFLMPKRIFLSISSIIKERKKVYIKTRSTLASRLLKG